MSNNHLPPPIATGNSYLKMLVQRLGGDISAWLVDEQGAMVPNGLVTVDGNSLLATFLIAPRSSLIFHPEISSLLVFAGASDGIVLCRPYPPPKHNGARNGPNSPAHSISDVRGLAVLLWRPGVRFQRVAGGFPRQLLVVRKAVSNGNGGYCPDPLDTADGIPPIALLFNLVGTRQSASPLARFTFPVFMFPRSAAPSPEPGPAAETLTPARAVNLKRKRTASPVAVEREDDMSERLNNSSLCGNRYQAPDSEDSLRMDLLVWSLFVRIKQEAAERQKIFRKEGVVEYNIPNSYGQVKDFMVPTVKTTDAYF
ncbi:hypothetical protein GGX14DRAFT_543501 [Mycena pura]|uniref:Uncharacterized protein n=1 Tax=Mycena pura TaxID=153505 RepID=A0AAD6VF33_9AGAR|nr:hypothetical protein GGX14DRAFT_543501 [Mycena pura]